MTTSLEILTRTKQHEQADAAMQEAIDNLMLAALLYRRAEKPTHQDRANREAARLRRLMSRLKLAV